MTGVPEIDPSTLVVAWLARREQRRLIREQLAEARRIGLARRHAIKLEQAQRAQGNGEARS